MAELKLVDSVWRQVARSFSQSDLVRGISDILAEVLPHREFLLIRVDADQRLATCIGASSRETNPGPDRDGRRSIGLDAGALGKLEQWCHPTRTLVGGPGDLPAPLRGFQEFSADTRVVVLTLSGEHDEVGLAAIVVNADGDDSDSQCPDEQTLERIEALAGPLGAALSHDHHFGDPAGPDAPQTSDSHFGRVRRRELSESVILAETALRDFTDWVRRVAPTQSPVLLIGETGTGREVLARTIHERSDSADGPMMRVNCGAVPRGLLYSELFGKSGAAGSFERGSQRPGWFERADGGTLLLDEIDKLPDRAQRTVLEVLEEGQFHPDKTAEKDAAPVPADVRLVAATHRDLEELVEAGEFRRDLWERLQVFPIRVPPLRERIDDIPSLAIQFAEEAGKRIGGAPLRPTNEDFDLLLDYDWPGNIRELRAVIERAAIIGNGRELHVEQALGVDRREDRRDTSTTDDGTLVPLEEAVRRHIIRALEATNGQVAGEGGAAEVLEMHPSTLRSKMEKLGLEAGAFR